MGNSESLKKLEYATEYNNDYIDSHNLTYNYLLKPMRNEFTYYKEIDMSSDNSASNQMNGPEVSGNENGTSQFSEDDPMMLNHTEPIKEEGVYYTSYLFEVINKKKLENDKLFADKNNDWSDLDENLKYKSSEDETNSNSTLASSDESKAALPPTESANTSAPADASNSSIAAGDGKRRNLKSHWEYKKFGTPHMDRKFLHDPYQSGYEKQPRLIITGSVTFHNTDGYLSAQEFDNIKINAMFLSVLSIVCVIWTICLFVYRNSVLPIHYIVSIVLYACFFEVMFTLIFYHKEN